MLKYVLPVCLFIFSAAYPQKLNKEFRATWVITWEYISGSSSVDQNKARIRQMLDDHKAANMTSVLLQVRQGGTAYYASQYEPWGSYAGSSYPGFDPLAFTIEEAHKRGLELHAWFNVFAASSTASGTPAQRHPEWICRDAAGAPMTSSIALSPGMDSVRNYTLKVAMEVVRNYDIDGFHLDYIRWNEYSSSEPSKRDSQQQQASGELDGRITDEMWRDMQVNSASRYLYDVDHPYSSGVPAGYSTWEDWWRGSVTSFVKNLHDSIRAAKPWVRLSCAALGKYNWSGWQGYGSVYQDAALWFNQGYIDQLTPMHYHWTNGAGFYGMLSGACPQCWQQFIGAGIATKRLYTVGPGSYILDENNVWYKHREIVDTCRTINWTDGYQFFSYGTWKSYMYWNTAAATFFKKRTKIRAAKFMKDTIPSAPTISMQKTDSLHYSFTVTPPANTSIDQWYILYRSQRSSLNADSAEIVDVHFGKTAYTVPQEFNGLQDFNGQYRYGATMADRYWNESPVSNLVLTDPVPSFAPKVVSTVPASGDSIEATAPIKITFSKGMTTSTVQSAIHFVPAIPISGYQWTNENHTVTLQHTQNFTHSTTYKMIIDSSAADINGVLLDGNGNGIPGDPYEISFRVVAQDITGPSIIAVLPDTGIQSSHIDVESPISIQFSELIDPASTTQTNFVIKNGANLVTKDIRLTTENNRSIVSLRPSAAFANNTDYTLEVRAAVKDLAGNPMRSAFQTTLRSSSLQYTYKKMIDDFNTEGGYWQTPGYSGSTVGIIDSGTAFGYSTAVFLPATSPMKSAYLQYRWDPAASSKLIREYLSTGAPRDVTFDTSYFLQVFIHGDGSGNRFRFAIDEGSNATTWPGHEVSQWYTINWTGWKLIEWQLNDPGSVGSWIGNGILDYPLYRIDSFQMTDAPGSAVAGKIYFDDLRIVKKTAVTGIEENKNKIIAAQLELAQNYPNPFNPETKISFSVPRAGRVSLKIYDILGNEMLTLIERDVQPGSQTALFNAQNLTSGIYFYTLSFEGVRLTKKMIVMR